LRSLHLFSAQVGRQNEASVLQKLYMLVVGRISCWRSLEFVFGRHVFGFPTALFQGFEKLFGIVIYLLPYLIQMMLLRLPMAYSDKGSIGFNVDIVFRSC